MARVLDKRGIGTLILVARRAESLHKLSASLEATCRIRTVDLTVQSEVLALIAAEPVVDLVINNAGTGYRGRLETQEPSRLSQLIDLNCRALMLLSHAWLPHMRRNQRGWILNVGSIVGFIPVPTSAVYAASKAFVLFSIAGPFWCLYRGQSGRGSSDSDVLGGPASARTGQG